MADTNFSNPKYDDDLNARIKALEDAMPTTTGWITDGVTYLNKFRVAAAGNDLAYKLQVWPGLGAEVTIAGQIEVSDAKPVPGTTTDIAKIARHIVPDRGSFKGEVAIIRSSSTAVSVGNVTCANDADGNLLVRYEAAKGIGMNDIPNGWMDIYISFHAGNYGQG